MGRTQLQDAVPMSLGSEFSGWSNTIHEDLERVAAELGETDMTSAELRQMIEEAESNKSDPSGVVTIEDFMQILKTQ